MGGLIPEILRSTTMHNRVGAGQSNTQRLTAKDGGVGLPNFICFGRSVLVDWSGLAST